MVSRGWMKTYCPKESSFRGVDFDSLTVLALAAPVLELSAPVSLVLLALVSLVSLFGPVSLVGLLCLFSLPGLVSFLAVARVSWLPFPRVIRYVPPRPLESNRGD